MTHQADDELVPLEQVRSWRSRGRIPIKSNIQNSGKCENPFRMTSLDHYHRNFPPFESVFGSQDEEACSSSHQEFSLLNLSTVSSSFLSISDRAAMKTTTSMQWYRYTNEDSFNNAVDQRWDELTCNTCSDNQDAARRISVQATAVPPLSIPSDYRPELSRSGVVVSSGSSPDGLEEIEVSTDVSLAIDEMFFRSDRVEALRTPERYKTNAIALRSPTRRKQGSEHDSNTSISSSAVESETKAMLRLALAGTIGHNASSSMSSSSSIASGHETTHFLDAPTGTPWNGSQIRQSSKQLYPLPPDLETSNTNGSFLLNQSAISTSSSDHHLQALQKPPRPLKSSENLQISHIRNNSSQAKAMLTSGPVESSSLLEVETSDTSFSLRSETSSKSQLIALQLLSPPRAASFPKDFASIWGLGDALSPIRPCKTDNGDDDDLSHAFLTSRTISQGRLKVESLQSNPWNSNIDDTNRRKYRTVVPSRVFMCEPSDFPMEDSFSPKSVH